MYCGCSTILLPERKPMLHQVQTVCCTVHASLDPSIPSRQTPPPNGFSATAVASAGWRRHTEWKNSTFCVSTWTTVFCVCELSHRPPLLSPLSSSPRLTKEGGKSGAASKERRRRRRQKRGLGRRRKEETTMEGRSERPIDYSLIFLYFL